MPRTTPTLRQLLYCKRCLSNGSSAVCIKTAKVYSSDSVLLPMSIKVFSGGGELMDRTCLTQTETIQNTKLLILWMETNQPIDYSVINEIRIVSNNG